MNKEICKNFCTFGEVAINALSIYTCVCPKSAIVVCAFNCIYKIKYYLVICE